MLDIIDIPRNDIDAALAYFREQLQAGTWGSDDARILLMLQDDPEELLEYLNDDGEEEEAEETLGEREDYSANQPRDSRGRFGSGGGGGGGGSDKVVVNMSQQPSAEERRTKDTESLYKKSGVWDPARVKEVHEGYTAEVTKGVPKSAEPVVYMTGGGPASGKSTGLLENPEAGIPTKKTAAHIDPDGAKLAIPEYADGVKAKDKTAAARAHEESSHMAKESIKSAIGEGHDVVYDSVGDSGIDKLQGKVDQMRSQGAKQVHAAYATVDVNEAIRRSDSRAERTGRYVPHEYIRAAHADVAKTTLAAIERGTFDTMKVFDTTTRTPKLIATYDKAAGGLTVVDPDGWAAHVARAQE